MPTIQQRYPDATVEVRRNSVVIPPEDYAAEGIELEFLANGQVELRAPNIGDSGGRYDVVFIPVGAVVAERVRLTLIEFPGETASSWGAGDESSSAELEQLIPPGPAYEIRAGGGWTEISVYGQREGA